LRYSRGRITVLDRAALQKHACGCYAAVKHDYLGVRTEMIFGQSIDQG
jgi:hypothetical protein